MRTLFYRWRLALAIARLRRAGAGGNPAAVAAAATEVKALVELISSRLNNHQVRWAAGKVQVASDRIVGDGP